MLLLIVGKDGCVIDFADVQLLPGGWSGRTFVARTGDQLSVVRIFPPDEPVQAPEVQAGVLNLVRGLLPVPRVLEVRRSDPSTDQPGLLVTEFLPGERGELVLPSLGEEGLAQVGHHVGRLVGTLGGMPALGAGSFDDAHLRIEPFVLAEDLAAWVSQHSGAFAGWSASERDGLAEVAFESQRILDSESRTCLVHSDLNPKNLLIDPDTLEITGLVDWEFAHAGHPGTDVGNVVRFDRAPAYVEAVVAGYREQRGPDPSALLELARAADLWALVELAARAGHNPITDRAHTLLLAIARARDRHAEP